MKRRDFFVKAGLGAIAFSGVGSLATKHSLWADEKISDGAGAAHAYDVVVCGGGTAGTIAAIQAARLGAKTLLVESGSQLGGTMTTCGVNFPGLFHAWGKQIIAGIGWELVEKTVLMHGDKLPDFTNYKRHHPALQVRLNEYLYACLAEEAAIAAGVEISYYTFPQNVAENGSGYTLELARRNRSAKVAAKQLLDCTGDGSLAGLAGFKRMKEDETQPGTLMFKISNYEMKGLDLKTIEKNFKDALAAGTLQEQDVWGGSARRMLKARGDNCQHILHASSATSREYSDTNIEARASFLRLYRFFKSQKGLENMKIDEIKTQTGVRETYRIVGETVISLDDYVSAKIYPDAVCHSFYPIDLHTRTGVKPKKLAEGRVPTVPLSALAPKGSKNFLVAGRCVSSDRLANSALRVQASCMAMGQSAGAAAALAAKANVSPLELNLGELRKTLVEHKAIVPSLS